MRPSASDTVPNRRRGRERFLDLNTKPIHYKNTIYYLLDQYTCCSCRAIAYACVCCRWESSVSSNPNLIVELLRFHRIGMHDTRAVRVCERPRTWGRSERAALHFAQHPESTSKAKQRRSACRKRGLVHLSFYGRSARPRPRSSDKRFGLAPELLETVPLVRAARWHGRGPRARLRAYGTTRSGRSSWTFQRRVTYQSPRANRITYCLHRRCNL